MPKLSDNLLLDRCPHCKIDNPNLRVNHTLTTKEHDGSNTRWWGVYVCRRCGGVVTAFSYYQASDVVSTYPEAQTIDEGLPSKAKAFLTQAINSYHAPSGAIMLAASAIDAMLKSKGYSEGKLYGRINKAAKEHLITEGMAEWAHQVRLDANDERHADDSAELPTTDDAKQTVEFALALAQFLFVLPERVNRGLAETRPATRAEAKQ